MTTSSIRCNIKRFPPSGLTYNLTQLRDKGVCGNVRKTPQSLGGRDRAIQSIRRELAKFIEDAHGG
jgi:hypothetical protein